MKLVAYLRVSTDDHGQNPERQADLVKAWAARDGHEIVAIIRDEGTSGNVPPMQRAQVQEAIRVANRLEAEAIVTEAVDRWTRTGPEDYFASRMELRLRHKLTLLHTTNPQGLEALWLSLYLCIEAVMAKVYRDNLVRQITSGLARAKREGWKNGRPGRRPKPNLTPEEIAYVREQKAMGTQGRRGAGWGRMALELTRRRGALEVVDGKAREKRTVRPSWLRMEWTRICQGSTVRTWSRVPASQPLEPEVLGSVPSRPPRPSGAAAAKERQARAKAGVINAHELGAAVPSQKPKDVFAGMGPTDVAEPANSEVVAKAPDGA